MGDAEKRAVMPPRVESWLATLAALQKASAQASLFLPKYDVRQAEARLATLRDEVDEARAQVCCVGGGSGAALVRQQRA